MSEISTMEIKDAFLMICAGEDYEAEFAFAWLFKSTWEEVVRVLNSKNGVLGLNLDEKKTAVSMAYQAFWKQARAGKFRDLNKDPRALLHVIAYRKAIDLLRKNTAQKRRLSGEECQKFADQLVKESSFRTQWQELQRNELAQEVISDFLEWMNEQKGVRFRTALAMSEFFPDMATTREIYETLCEKLNPPPTFESVKKARTDVLKKFRKAIKTKYEGLWKL